VKPRCPHPLVVHRFLIEDRGLSRRRLELECIDPDCDGTRNRHNAELPCAWSWQFAHGKAFLDERFPRRNCPSCAHIRRAGTPDPDVYEQLLRLEIG
jgi:hypothetical protein